MYFLTLVWTIISGKVVVMLMYHAWNCHADRLKECVICPSGVASRLLIHDVGSWARRLIRVGPAAQRIKPYLRSFMIGSNWSDCRLTTNAACATRQMSHDNEAASRDLSISFVLFVQVAIVVGTNKFVSLWRAQPIDL